MSERALPTDLPAAMAALSREQVLETVLRTIDNPEVWRPALQVLKDNQPEMAAALLANKVSVRTLSYNLNFAPEGRHMVMLEHCWRFASMHLSEFGPARAYARCMVPERSPELSPRYQLALCMAFARETPRAFDRDQGFEEAAEGDLGPRVFRDFREGPTALSGCHAGATYNAYLMLLWLRLVSITEALLTVEDSAG